MVSEYEFKDIPQINELGKTLNSNFKKLFHINELNNNEKIYVYKEKKEILGFLQIAINYEIVDILNIVVKDNQKNRGIGSLLMDYMITELPKDVKKILLEVNENNEEAIRFYLKFNFQIINERKNYYRTNSAYIMERNL
jgi:ribosomal protein S18 acetylase RimI-like enzyme